MENPTLTDEFYKARRNDLKLRVSEKRLKHIDGVAKTAKKLASAYGVDVSKAKIAGLLHDWDKNLNDEEIRERVYELGLLDEIDPWILENMPRVLHGPTAAVALARQFPELPFDVIDAIKKHTTASPEMSELAKIIYISDAIEPSRKFEEVEYLRDLIGEVSLDELYFAVYKFWTMALLKHDIVLHPDTIRIWNSLVENKKREREQGKLVKCDKNDKHDKRYKRA